MIDQTKDVDILLVEDNPTDAELAILALQDRKLANKLIWVRDGAEALDFIFATGRYAYRNVENYPSVILLDLRLPKVDGLEVLRRLKFDERTRNIPIAIVTSSKEDKDIVASYDLGVNSFISKPVEFDEFAKVISDLGYYWIFINRPPVHIK